MLRKLKGGSIYFMSKDSSVPKEQPYMTTDGKRTWESDVVLREPKE